MFVDFRDQPPPPPWQPAPSHKPRLTPREESTLARVIGINLALLIVAPIGGATLFEFAVMLLR